MAQAFISIIAFIISVIFGSGVFEQDVCQTASSSSPATTDSMIEAFLKF